jgi:hypothetical protein
VENVRKYLPKSDAMVKGNINQIRQHLRTKQPAVTEPDLESEMVQEVAFSIFNSLHIIRHEYLFYEYNIVFDSAYGALWSKLFSGSIL